MHGNIYVQCNLMAMSNDNSFKKRVQSARGWMMVLLQRVSVIFDLLYSTAFKPNVSLISFVAFLGRQ